GDWPHGLPWRTESIGARPISGIGTNLQTRKQSAASSRREALMKNFLRKALEWGKERVRPYYLRWLYFPLFPHREPKHFQNSWRYPSRKITQNFQHPEGEGRKLPEILF